MVKSADTADLVLVVRWFSGYEVTELALVPFGRLPGTANATSRASPRYRNQRATSASEQLPPFRCSGRTMPSRSGWKTWRTSRPNHDEPTSVSKAAKSGDGTPTHVDGRARCHQRRI